MSSTNPKNKYQLTDDYFDAIMTNLDNNEFIKIVSILKQNYPEMLDMQIIHGTALTMVCKRLCNDVNGKVKILLEANVDIDIPDPHCRTPFHILLRNSSKNCNNYTTKLLMKQGADLDTQDIFGITPLMETCKLWEWNWTKKLIKKGVSLNKQNNFGNTALIHFIKYQSSNDKCTGGIHYLIDAGANIDIKNDEGKDALYYAKKYKLDDIVERLYDKKLENLTQYYENLLQEKLKEQKTLIYEDIYAPNGIGYHAAKDRFESQ